MATTITDILNDRFSISDNLIFKTGPDGLTFADIANKNAHARVSLQGGQVIAYQPLGQEPVLWLSRLSRFEANRAIRGGIPICWPWYGDNPASNDLPTHGFARTAQWRIAETNLVADDSVQVKLKLTDNNATQALWPHAFELQIVITVGYVLRVELIIENTGNKDFVYSGGLHSYFRVSNVSDVVIHGLEGCSYIDELDNWTCKLQEGPVTIDAEVDRIYLDTTSECFLQDPGFKRVIRIAKAGSHSTVVWNPWKTKAKHLSDFGDQEYLETVCIETTNAYNDEKILPPGQQQFLSALISTEPYKPIL